MSTEAALWQLVKKNVKGHLIRVENTAGSGTPDVHACHESRETWIELKLAKGNWLHFRSSQLAFFAKRCISQDGRVQILWRKQNEICVTNAHNIMVVLEDSVANKDGSVKIPIEKITHEKFFKPWAWDRISEKVYV